MAFNVGDTVGDYRVLGILGRGGMGAVYRVQNILSHREEAMKIVLPHIDSDSETAERFLREIRVQASLRHPNIAEFRTAVRAGGQILMILELIEGDSLRAKLEQGPIPFDLTFRIIDEMLNALGYAHKHGVVHRDIKPGNIMVTSRGFSKLTDFGIAHAAGEAPITQTNMAIGSLDYMSPEQIQSGLSDERCDLYSLGVTFYEMLTGRLPVTGRTLYEVMQAHVTLTPARPDELVPSLSWEISGVVMKALAKSPTDRFQSAEAFQSALRDALFSSAPRTASSVAPGKTISHYRLLSTLGKGGMGVVYKAQDTRLGRTVALKFVPETLAGDRSALERFAREARAASALNHPNICTVHDIGEFEGRPFLVMECLEGNTLRESIVRSPLEISDVLKYSLQMVDALEAAHAAGIIHRDIKPANLFVTLRGQVKIMDFGLAKVTSPGSGKAETTSQSDTATINQLITNSGSTLGTVAYMSPEQARGEELDPRSDLFALGIVLYEMVTGTSPFQGNTMALTFASILYSPAAPPSRLRAGIPVELEVIVLKCLEKDRAARYQSAAEIEADLKQVNPAADRPRTTSTEAQLSSHASPPPLVGGTQFRSSLAPAAVAPAPSSAEYVVTRIRRHWAAAAILGVIIILLAAAGIFLMTRTGPLDSIAVLPFVNMAGDPGTEYLSDGIAESIINNLSQLPKLSVRSFNSVAHYKNKDVSAETAGRELKVRAVLTGRLVRRGDEFAISAELVDVNGNRQIWGSQYTQRVTDLLAIQQQISQQISEKLRLQLTGEEIQRLNKQSTGDAEAYQLYLQGRYQWNKRTLEGLQQSIDYFNQAIQKDPRYALAYAGQADAYALMTDFNVLPAREVIPKLQAAAAKAIELDNNLAEAHTSLAWAAFHVWDWVGAEKEFKRALELNPSYPTAHLWYGQFLLALGRFDGALAELNQAVQQDSLSPDTNLSLGYRLYYARQYAPAIEQSQKVLAMDSTFVAAHALLGRVYAQEGKFANATDEFRKALDLSQGDTNDLAALGYAYAVSHQDAEARKTLEELMKRAQDTYVQPAWLAVIYIGLGDKNLVFDWLEKAYSDRSEWLVDLKVDPMFDSVRADPRFVDLLRRVGLN